MVTRIRATQLLLPIFLCLLSVLASGAVPERLNVSWPPQVDEPYPDLQLLDYRGKRVRLSDFKGKVILVEPVGMSCPACNAFSGANDKGEYQGVRPQRALPSIEQLLPKFASGLTIDHADLVVVQLLLFDLRLKAPSVDDARLWAEHFGFDKKSNVYVLTGTKAFLAPEVYRATYNLIPRFQLVDKNFILRYDSTGHHPRDNLFDTLLPMVPKLLTE
jgi:hypothetical protein